MSGVAPRATPSGSAAPTKASVTPASIVGEPARGRKSAPSSSRNSGDPLWLAPMSTAAPASQGRKFEVRIATEPVGGPGTAAAAARTIVFWSVAEPGGASVQMPIEVDPLVQAVTL